MNRRVFLRFLGLAPVGVAAVAAVPSARPTTVYPWPQPIRHCGGYVNGKPYLVGEHGPEVYQAMSCLGIAPNEARKLSSKQVLHIIRAAA